MKTSDLGLCWQGQCTEPADRLVAVTAAAEPPDAVEVAAMAERINRLGAPMCHPHAARWER